MKLPAGGWRYSNPDDLARLVAEDRIHFGADESKVPAFKRYLSEFREGVLRSVVDLDRAGAAKRLRNLLGCDAFAFPKDEILLAELISAMTGKNDVVLAFFAGSGTTAPAVLLQNQLDGGNRTFIVTQSPEPSENDVRAAGFETISELTSERIARAAECHGGRFECVSVTGSADGISLAPRFFRRKATKEFVGRLARR